MKKLLTIAILSLFFGNAFADQCHYVNKKQAQAALKIALETKTIQTLCEPCGENIAQSLSIKSIGIADVDFQGYWELQVNGQGLDLAYTYVNGMNLATLVSCSTTSVSKSIK